MLFIVQSSTKKSKPKLLKQDTQHKTKLNSCSTIEGEKQKQS